MPFVSEKQRKLCWYLYNKAIQAGKNPKWDCNLWEEETKKKTSKNDSKRKSNKRKRVLKLRKKK
jgi:hypothetical protein